MSQSVASYVDELNDKMRQPHPAMDLGFPEFKRHVRIEALLATVDPAALLPERRRLSEAFQETASYCCNLKCS